MIRTLLLHHPEILVALGCLIAGFAYYVGFAVGRRHGWQSCAQRNAEMLRERERQEGTVTRTFTGNIGNPEVLAAAFNAMAKLQAEGDTSGIPSNPRKITPNT
jgi:hypothetical protein